jgi:N-acetylglucosamine transport system substrate-binding protein
MRMHAHRIVHGWRSALLLVWLILSVATARPQPITLEVAVFHGGYGIDYFEQCVREYEQLNPNVKIKLSGHPRVWEQLLPRFGTKDVPDLCWPGWGMNLWEIIFGGQLRPLDVELQESAFGSDKKWIDTFKTSMLQQGRYQGKQYVLPFAANSFGWYYNGKLFRENGWAVPKTYDELLSVSEQIKAKGIAPLTFTGRYPEYAISGIFLAFGLSAGGMEGFIPTQNLEPGAWLHPAWLRAAEAIIEMKQRDIFQAGAAGMSHIESQMEFLIGRAAMIPCGTWFHSEMAKMLPPDFEADFMPPPAFADGEPAGTYVYAGVDGKGWCIPTAAKHPREAIEFCRYVLAPQNAKRFAEAKGALTAILYDSELNVPPHLEEPMRLIAESKSTYTYMVGEWYPKLMRAQVDAFRDLYNELLTPREFVQKMENLSQRTARDPSVRKFRMETP